MNIYIIQHVDFEGPGYILDWALNNGHKVNYIRLYEKVEFPSVDAVDMLVVMGGPMSVYEENIYSWLKLEKKFISDLINADKFVLGVCLGSQLIAEVLGAKVFPGPQKEIGWFPVLPSNPKLLMDVSDVNTSQKISKLFASNPTVFHWHGDTFDLPKAATRLLSSEICKNQAFLYNDKVLALQFHIEVTVESVLQMINNGRDELIPGKYIQSETQILSDKSHYSVINQTLKAILDLLVK